MAFLSKIMSASFPVEVAVIFPKHLFYFTDFHRGPLSMFLV